MTPRCLCLLLFLKLPLVEGQLLALENVAVGTATLPRTGGDGSQETSALELLLDGWIQLLLRVEILLLADDMVAALHLSFILGFGIRCLLSLLNAKHNTILPQVPLLERLTIDLHNCILQERLGTHQLVACSIVDDIQDTHFLCA